MSSQYPILGGRPIDHWKVTELKEELKRRKLTTKGLKDDLIKRLDEAIRVEREALRVERETLRVERENAVEDVNNKVNLGTQPMVEVKNAEVVPIVAEKAKDLMDNISNKIEKVDYMAGQVDINASVEPIGQGTVQEGAIKDDISLFRVEGEPTLPVTVTAVDSNAIVTETVVAQAALGGQAVQNSETEMDYKNSNIQMESEDTKLQLDNVEKKPQLEIQDSKPQLENEGLKAEPDVSMLDSSAPDNQVPEVSPNLGSQVNSDSISTDSVSINEKIDLKDNIIADNVKLELDVVKPEIVEPSPSNVVPVSGESHLMDVEESQQNKASVEENYDSNATNGEMSQKNDIVDLGDSEKLNLDAGDDSMEEDVLEGKQDDLKYNSDEVGDRSEKSEAPIVKKESAVDAVGTVIPTDQKEILGEDNNQSAPPLEKRKLSDTDQKEIHGENNNWLEKRKLNDKDSVGSAEPAKRQRRWNSETIKTPEPQSSTPKATATPKDGSQPTLKRNFSRSDSSVTEDPAKERIVPPSQNPATNSLRIDRFLRPFTLKAVQELLGKTGKVTSFWMDPIKTHCYVTYSSVEEAIETRNSVYNLQWPPNGGRLLVAEFVEPQEVKMMVEGPPQSPAASVTPTGAAPGPAIMPQPSPRVQVSRQQLPPPPALPPPPPLSNPPVVKERFAHPPPLPHQEKHDPPIVTLDDLFRKTKATPRIYYLPLSEEQATARCRKTKQ